MTISRRAAIRCSLAVYPLEPCWLSGSHVSVPTRSRASCCLPDDLAERLGYPQELLLLQARASEVVRALFHFRQRAPYGIKDERIRNFVIESFKSDERPIEDLFGRGGGLVFEFKQLAKDVRRGLKRIKTGRGNLPSARR